MEFVIVLGNSSLLTRKNRVSVAVKYAKGKPCKIMFCGRGTQNESEADNMKELAIGMGYSEEVIIENKSMTTYENIRFALNRLQELGWFKPTYIANCVFTICTSKYHRCRALLTALSLLGRFGKVQIIHDEDEGCENVQRMEKKGLIDYANFFANTMHAPS